MSSTKFTEENPHVVPPFFKKKGFRVFSKTIGVYAPPSLAEELLIKA